MVQGEAAELSPGGSRVRSELIPPIWLDEHGRRVPTRPCHVPNCTRERAVHRYRFEQLADRLWTLVPVVAAVTNDYVPTKPRKTPALEDEKRHSYYLKVTQDRKHVWWSGRDQEGREDVSGLHSNAGLV